MVRRIRTCTSRKRGSIPRPFLPEEPGRRAEGLGLQLVHRGLGCLAKLPCHGVRGGLHEAEGSHLQQLEGDRGWEGGEGECSSVHDQRSRLRERAHRRRDVGRQRLLYVNWWMEVRQPVQPMIIMQNQIKMTSFAFSP